MIAVGISLCSYDYTSEMGRYFFELSTLISPSCENSSPVTSCNRPNSGNRHPHVSVSCLLSPHTWPPSFVPILDVLASFTCCSCDLEFWAVITWCFHHLKFKRVSVPTFPGPPLNSDFPQAIMLERGVAVAVMAQPPWGSFDKRASAICVCRGVLSSEPRGSED